MAKRLLKVIIIDSFEEISASRNGKFQKQISSEIAKAFFPCLERHS